MHTLAQPPIPPIGYCPHCTYPINPGRCPECGNFVEKPSPRGPAQRRFWRRVCIGSILVAFACAAALLFNYRVPIGTAFIPAAYALQGSTGSSWFSPYLRDVRDAQLAEYNAFEHGGILELHKKLQAELRAGSGPAWAGEYSLWGGDFGEHLTISPAGRFAWHSFSNGGSCANRGSVKAVTGDQLDLRLDFDQSVFRTGPARRFLRCTWKRQDYLVLDGAMPWFLNQVNGHSMIVLVLKREARAEGAGDYFPHAFARYVHREPLICHITRVLDTTARPEGSGSVRSVRIECDAGDRQNVFVGMQFYPVRRLDGYPRITVVELHASACVAEYSEYCEPNEAFHAPEIGWQLSSRSALLSPGFLIDKEDE